MRFFQKTKLLDIRRRYESARYAEWVITEVLSSFQLNYSIDTWKLPDFERVLLGIKDFVDQPTWWNIFGHNTLYIGRELQIFFFTLYIYFVTTRSLALSWQWIYWAESEWFMRFYFIDLDDRHLTQLDDPDLLHFYTTFVFYLRNENTPLLIWEYTFYSIFSVFNYYWVFFKKFNNNVLNSFVDSRFYSNIRYTFKMSIRSLLFKFSINNIITLLSVLKVRLLNIQYFNFFKKNFQFYTKFKKVTYVKLNTFLKLVPYLSKRTEINKQTAFITFNKPIIFDDNSTNLNTASLLRKQRVFTKSKYARSRQYCKNIVLIGLLLNIVLMYGLNSGYYAILINAGYFIYPLYFILVVFSVYFFIKFELHNVFRN